MDTLQWRKWACRVAYVDLVLSSLNLLGVIMIAILAGEFLSSEVGSEVTNAYFDTTEPPVISTTTMVIIWLGVAFLAASTLIQAWATLELVSATEVKEGKIIEALKKCGLWRNVQIIALIIQSADYILMGYYVIFAVGLLIRGAFLCIVYKFMEELDLLLNPIPGPVTASS